MLTMEKIQEVRFRFFVKGEKISQIAAAMDLDWKTARKYVDKADFNERVGKPGLEKHFLPKLDPFKATIDQWLGCDRNAPRKQRHTARRAFNRLKEEFPEFNLSYRTVASYYVFKRREVFSGAKKGFLPLDHRTPESQMIAYISF